MEERIAKVMARLGLCSRREAERWIEDKRVSLNGHTVKTPALKINTAQDSLSVDGEKVEMTPPQTRLWLYHKPDGLLTTHKDDLGRPTVFGNLPKDMPRTISVGRLDYNTEGLLLLTNSGELARHLELPSTGWIRRYKVRVYGKVNQQMLDKLEKGGKYKDPKSGKLVKYGPVRATISDKKVKGSNIWLDFTLKEGKNREIRNLCANLDLKVSRLIRISYGPFQLGKLAPGEIKEVPEKVIKEQINYESNWRNI